MENTSSPRSSAQKRIIWELGRRYTSGGSRSKASPHMTSRSLPPTTPPKREAVRSRRRKGSWLRRSLLIIVALFTLGAGVFGYKILAASNRISTADRSLLGQLRDLLFRSSEKLQGEEDGRINIMLLAVGGEGHSGETLADTIMVASIRPHPDKPSEVALLSIPRDLYVQVPGEEYFSKINAVHAYGEAKEKDHGPEVLDTKVEEITGLPIHYYVRVDFTAFKHIVDAVGGLTITIDRSFFDYWHKIDFQAGTEKMNGERALAYVRARYIEGPEGGDFRRATRQQQVLLALQDKVFSVQTAFDFTAINSILNSLSDNIRTDMHLWEMKRFYELARSIDRSQVHSTVLTTGPNSVLEGGTEMLGGTPASILRPRTGDYSEIQSLAQNIFDGKILKEALPEGESNPTPPPDEQTGLATGLPATPAPVASKPSVEIRNGTNVTGLAARFQEKLRKEGYEVKSIGNAKNRSTSKTTVYSLDGKYVDAATSLAEDLHAQADSGLPSDESSTEANTLIILGADAEKLLGE